jgi:hypothetical protein
MQILCEVNQVECFRRGIDAPRSTIKIEVNPAKLPEDIREFLADHLYDGYKLGSDACLQLRSPDLMGLLETVLAAKEYAEAKDGGRLRKSEGMLTYTASFDEWIKGEGKTGSANREKLAKELAKAQEAPATEKRRIEHRMKLDKVFSKK